MDEATTVHRTNHKAPIRRYSHGRSFRGREEFAAEYAVVPRRAYAPPPYDNRPRKNGGLRNLVWTSPDYQASQGNNRPRKNALYGPRRSSSISDTTKPKDCVCRYWKAGKCNKGDQCRFLHSWSSFPGLVMLASLDGHDKDLTGITFPQGHGSDKLYSVSTDGKLRVWDCHSGQCVITSNLEGEAGSLISEGPWVFLGLPNAVKAYNVETNQDLHLNGVVVGQVHAMAVGYGMLFAGTSSGAISIWKATDETESDPFKYLTSLEEGHHSGEVTCLFVVDERLSSGSADTTINVWDLKTLQCVKTLRQHTDTVTSLLCWDQFLLSSSLDGAIHVWARSEENGVFKVTYTHRQQQSVHSLCGMNDAEQKPILFSSHQDGTVCIYDLPSFEQRGKLFSTDTIGTLTIGPYGLLFSGDKSGNLRVWSLPSTKP